MSLAINLARGKVGTYRFYTDETDFERWRVECRDALADECVNAGLMVRSETLQLIVHPSNPSSPDMYDHIGSVGYTVEVK